MSSIEDNIQLEAKPRHRPGPRFPAGTKDRPRSGNLSQVSANIFINYIPPDYSDSDLRALCAPYGTIRNSKIMINLETGQSKCFGFVRYETLEQAKTAIKELNGKSVGTKRLLVKFAESKEKIERKSMTVYVKRLPLQCDENCVCELFSKYGEVLQITPHVIGTIDPYSWRCFVRYASYENATNAISGMNNKIIYEGTPPIHCKYADASRLSGTFSFTRSSLDPTMIDTVDQRQLLPSFFFM